MCPIRAAAVANGTEIPSAAVTPEATFEQAPASAREERDRLYRTILGAIEGYRALDQSAFSAEDNATELIRLSHLRDLLSVEISRRADGLAQSDVCVDWGSNSTTDWIRHHCKV